MSLYRRHHRFKVYFWHQAGRRHSQKKKSDFEMESKNLDCYSVM